VAPPERELGDERLDDARAMRVILRSRGERRAMLLLGAVGIAGRERVIAADERGRRLDGEALRTASSARHRDGEQLAQLIGVGGARSLEDRPVRRRIDDPERRKRGVRYRSTQAALTSFSVLTESQTKSDASGASFGSVSTYVRRL
jgi:hypothetical protein